MFLFRKNTFFLILRNRRKKIFYFFCSPPQNYNISPFHPTLSTKPFTPHSPANGYPKARRTSCKIWRKTAGGRGRRRCLSHLTQPCVLVLLYNADTFFNVGDKIFHDLDFILLCVSLNFHWEYHLVKFMVKKFANGKFDHFPFCADKGEIVIVKFVHKHLPDSCRAQLLVNKCCGKNRVRV